jgi:hypothetical protein
MEVLRVRACPRACAAVLAGVDRGGLSTEVLRAHVRASRAQQSFREHLRARRSGQRPLSGSP